MQYLGVSIIDYLTISTMKSYKNAGTFFLAFVLGFAGIASTSVIDGDMFKAQVAEAFRAASTSEPVYRASVARFGQVGRGGSVRGDVFDPSSCELYLYDYLKFGTEKQTWGSRKASNFS